jgi:hypothetical protein
MTTSRFEELPNLKFEIIFLADVYVVLATISASFVVLSVNEVSETHNWIPLIIEPRRHMTCSINKLNIKRNKTRFMWLTRN